jgi:hydroxymethylpyrimidine pyrophosphatase-like HAD family hydrolase
MMKNQKFPPTRTIAVDVDGTLHVNGILNVRVVEFCERQKANGFTLNLWSARGKEYAQAAAEKFGVSHLFDDIISKPGYVLDDQGWNWIKYTQIIRTPHEAPNAEVRGAEQASPAERPS